MRVWKSLVIYLSTGIFLLTFTGHLYSPGSHDPYAEDDIVMTGEDFIEKINVTNPLHKNFYISSPSYKHRLKPKVNLDRKVNNYHPVTYVITAEIARRYSARYIIDLGCGSAAKLAKLAGEFNVIGIDYGGNYKRAKTNYPHLKILEADLDRVKGCYVRLPPDILLQSVVISADVIEHLTDPFRCYLKLLKYMTTYAMAAVMTSPDRERMSLVLGKKQALYGPPIPDRHVREWTVYEMDRLLLDNNFQVLFSGWACSKYQACGKGFLPRDNPLTQQITVLGNSNIRRSWKEGKLAQSSIGVKITVFLMVYPKTNQTMVEQNLRRLLHQRMHVVLIRINNTLRLDIPIAGRVVVDQYAATTPQEVTSIITDVFSRPYYNHGDWFLVHDAHENILTSDMAIWNLSLRDAFLQIAQEPYGFNAVAFSYFFIDNQDGHHQEKLPFKVFGLSPWDSNNVEMLGPIVDTLAHRVKAWRKTTHRIELRTMVTEREDTIVTDVHFMGRKVYPFNMISLRMFPSRHAQKSRVEERTMRMYVLDAMLGFMPSSRVKVMTSTFPY